MIKEVLKVSLILFAVIDILGGLPILIDLRKKIPDGKIKSEKVTIVSLIIMLLFQYIGEDLLGLFGVDIQSFAIVGALIISFIGLEMVLNIEIFKQHPDESKAGAIIPIAFPLIAGAGSLTTIISLKSLYDPIVITMGVILNLGFVYLVLKMTQRIEKLLGPSGVMILRKVFGIILLSISISMVKTNLGF